MTIALLQTVPADLTPISVSLLAKKLPVPSMLAFEFYTQRGQAAEPDVVRHRRSVQLPTSLRRPSLEILGCAGPVVI